MKTSKLILIFALAALHTISFAQKKETSWLKNCSKLSYHVNYNTLEYDFILDSMAVSDGIGFNWKMNVALVAGFSAKEVVVSTFGTIYSRGSNLDEDSSTLKEALEAVSESFNVDLTVNEDEAEASLEEVIEEAKVTKKARKKS